MRNHIKIIVLIIIAILFSSCKSSDIAIQKAIARTQTAQPAHTSEPTLTIELMSMPDLRVIDGDLRSFLITEEDVSNEGYDFHYTKFGFSEPEYETTNDKVVASEYYDEVDQTLIFELGRISSWTRQFMKTEKTSEGKESESNALSCTATLFSTADGARQSVERYNRGEEGFLSYVDINLDLGDTNVVYSNSLLYAIEFSYRNVAVVIRVSGYDINNLETAEPFASIVLKRLQEASLINPSDASFADLPSEDIVLAPTNDNRGNIKLPGFYLVNIDIAPGVWRNFGDSDSCYWSVTNWKGEIIDNFFGMTGGTMYVPTNAFQVEISKECGAWVLLVPLQEKSSTPAPSRQFTPTPTAIAKCPSAPRQRLEVGKFAMICTKLDQVRLRVEPGIIGKFLQGIYPDVTVKVIGGPKCANNWSWWQVELKDGVKGWLAEGGDEIDPYFLCPVK